MFGLFMRRFCMFILFVLVRQAGFALPSPSQRKALGHREAPEMGAKSARSQTLCTFVYFL